MPILGIGTTQAEIILVKIWKGSELVNYCLADKLTSSIATTLNHSIDILICSILFVIFV